MKANQPADCIKKQWKKPEIYLLDSGNINFTKQYHDYHEGTVTVIWLVSVPIVHNAAHTKFRRLSAVTNSLQVGSANQLFYS